MAYSLQAMGFLDMQVCYNALDVSRSQQSGMCITDCCMHNHVQA